MGTRGGHTQDAIPRHWHPSAGRSVDPWSAPWFDVYGSMVYPADGHPDGRSPGPQFQIRGVFVYAVGARRSGASVEPWYRIDGSWVCRASGHPDGPSAVPSFLQRDDGP